MKIKFIKEDAKNALKSNIKGNLENYQKNNNNWIYQRLQDQNPFLESNIVTNDFNLIIYNNKQDKSLEYFENTKTLYTAMKHITDVQAADERLWSGLAHNQLWYYTNNNYLLNNSFNESAVLNTFFLDSTKRGFRSALLRNPLSRLWWVGRLTYDENRENKFELTEYFKTGFSTKCYRMLSYNFTSNSNVLKGMISALLKLDKENFKIGTLNRENYYKACSYLNRLGGTHILDYFTQGEIEDRVLTYLKNY